MQLALQDIGQLTDIGLDAAFAPVEGVSPSLSAVAPFTGKGAKCENVSQSRCLTIEATIQL
jgi:hypothetical protein